MISRTAVLIASVLATSHSTINESGEMSLISSYVVVSFAFRFCMDQKKKKESKNYSFASVRRETRMDERLTWRRMTVAPDLASARAMFRPIPRVPPLSCVILDP